MDAIYDLITLNKEEIVKIIPHPTFGKGPYICDTQCSLDINYLRNPIQLDDVNCRVDPVKRYIKIKFKEGDNHIIYKGAANAVSAGYIKAPNNIVSDKYVLQEIYIFPYVRNHIADITNIDDLEIQLVHKSETGIYINIVIHITNKGGDSVQSALYETLFNSIISSHKADIKKVEAKAAKYNPGGVNSLPPGYTEKTVEAPYSKTLGELCNTKNSTCMTSVIANDFIIDNTVDPQFYSWLDLNVGYKLYWITFDKTIPISPSVFESIKKYMTPDTDTDRTGSKHINPPVYKTPVIGELIYYKIDNVTYNRRHYLYITLGGTEIPGYAQGEYGKREDKADDDSKAHCKNDKNDNLIVVNTPEDEKIVIEVDNKITESFINLKNNINSRISNIRESFATINIKEENQGQSHQQSPDNRNIIIYILGGIIILYIIYRLVVYTMASTVSATTAVATTSATTTASVSYMATLISYITFIPLKIRDTVFTSTSSGDKQPQAGGNMTSYDIEPDTLPGTAPITSDKQPVAGNTMGVPPSFTGGGKYKLGFKKIKRKLI